MTKIKDLKLMVLSPLKARGGLEHVHFDHTCEPLMPESPGMQATADKSSVGLEPTVLSSLSDPDISGSRDINLLKSNSCKEVDTTMFEKYEKGAPPLNEFEVGLALKTKEQMLDASSGNEQNTQTRHGADSDIRIDGVIENKEVLKPDYEVKYEENMKYGEDLSPLKKGKLRGAIEQQTCYFSLRHIKAATSNFDHTNTIGEGGFGPVYKAGMQNSFLGVVLATAHFTSSMVALPPAISAVIMNIMGSSLGYFWRCIDPADLNTSSTIGDK